MSRGTKKRSARISARQLTHSLVPGAVRTARAVAEQSTRPKLARPTRTLVEQAAVPADAKIDLEEGVIFDVKLLGTESVNGVDGMTGVKRRVYPAAVLEAAARLYEGAKVYLEHPRKPGEARASAEHFGVVSGIYAKPDGLYAKRFEFKKSHGRTADLLETIRRWPDKIGLSPHHVVRGEREGDAYRVTEIVEVLSVDLVDSPATTHGLFEGQSMSQKKLAEQDDVAAEKPEEEVVEQEPEAPVEVAATAPTVQSIHDDVTALKASLDPSMVKDEFLAKLDEVLAALEELGAAGAAAEEEEPAEEEKPMESRKGKAAKPGTLTVAERENRALRLAVTAGVTLSEAKLKALTALESEADVKAFLAEEKAAKKPAGQAPRSAAPGRPVTESKASRTLDEFTRKCFA